MRYEELPEIPRIWNDFIHSRLPFLPPFPTMQVLLERREAMKIRANQGADWHRFLTGGREHNSSPALKNIQRLRQSEAVAVVTNFYVSLFGGPFYQILKCLTAIRICEELAKHNVEAVPLCWVSAEPPPDFTEWSITLLDQQSELHKFELHDPGSMDHASPGRLPWSRVSALLSRIDSIGKETYDAEILEALRSVFVPDTDFSSASALLISNLMSEWGMVVLNADTPEFKAVNANSLAPILDPPGRVSTVFRKQASELAKEGYELNPSESVVRTFYAQSSLLPILGIVLDPLEFCSCIAALPLLEEAGLPQPLIWPQPNATIMDARRRRILARYNLDLHQLYAGEEKVSTAIRDSVPHSAPEILNDLKLKVEECITELETLAPNKKTFTKKSASYREKILYQLEKLRKHYADARKKREQTVNRQIHKACNFLAPNRRLQERELAGIQIPLRYSRAGLRFLYEKLDIGKMEHQLISMD